MWIRVRFWDSGGLQEDRDRHSRSRRALDIVHLWGGNRSDPCWILFTFTIVSNHSCLTDPKLHVQSVYFSSILRLLPKIPFWIQILSLTFNGKNNKSSLLHSFWNVLTRQRVLITFYLCKYNTLSVRRSNVYLQLWVIYILTFWYKFGPLRVFGFPN